MLVTRTSVGASVCLRCRVRLSLSRRNNARISPSFGSSPCARSLSFASFPDSSDTGPDKYAETADLPIEAAPKVTRKRILRGPRVTGAAGQRLLATGEPLGRGVLGKPAEVLVLRETQEWVKPKQPVSAIPRSNDRKAPTEDDLLEALTSEKRTPKELEVFRQIENCRPKTDPNGKRPLLDRKEYASLGKTLERGFTSSQLKQYIQTQGGQVGGEVGPILVDVNADLGISTSGWRPGSTPVRQKLAPVAPLRGAVIGARSGKRHLIECILRRVWGVEIQEEVESPGELELQLTDWQMRWLHSGRSNSILNNIGRDRKVDIEVTWPKKTIRIRASKSKAEYAVKDIVGAIQESAAMDIKLAPFWKLMGNNPNEMTGRKSANLPWDESDILTASELSGASIDLDEKEQQIRIRSMHKEDSEDALRALMSMLPQPSDSTPVAILDDEKTAHFGVLHPVGPTPSLRHADRKRPMGRWTLPIKRIRWKQSNPEEEESEEYSAFFEPPSASNPQTQQVERDAFDGLENISSSPSRAERAPEKNRNEEPDSVSAKLQAEACRFLDGSTLYRNSFEKIAREETSPSHSYWQYIARSEESARLGHVLQPTLEGLNTMSFRLPQTKTFTQHWRFSANVPRLPAFLSRISNMASSAPTTTQTLSFMLRATPFTSDQPPTIFPQISMDFAVPEGGDGNLSFAGMTLYYKTRTAYALLPEKVADIMFNEVKTLHSPAATLTTGAHPQIDEYVGAIQQTISKKGRLRAPRFIDLKIPKPVIRLSSGAPKPAALAGSQWERAHEELVTYEFSGVRGKQDVQFHLPDLGGAPGEARVVVRGLEEGSLGSRAMEVIVLGDGDTQPGLKPRAALKQRKEQRQALVKRAWGLLDVLEGVQIR